MSTPHIEATAGSIAPVVLMPGDPRRAAFIASHFLTDPVQINSVRNMLGFTGQFHGQPVTVMGSGMGMPSMGIYAHELYQHYAVEQIIRVGTCGSYTRDLALYDVLIADSAWTESTFARLYSGQAQSVATPDASLTSTLASCARSLHGNEKVHLGRVHSTDVFYRHPADDFRTIYQNHQCLAVEMEAFALFHIAAVHQRQAATILTVSDCLDSGAAASSQEREQAFTRMIEIALNSACNP